MRLIGRMLLAILLLLGASYGWYALNLNISFKDQTLEPWEDNYERYITYLIRPGETLQFDVPNEATQIRILHTAVGRAAEDKTVAFKFAAEGQVALTETYTLSVSGEPSPAAASPQPPARFFDSPDGAAASTTKLHIVSFTQSQSFNEFALTLTESDRPFAIRVAVLEQYDEKSVSRVWQRMTEEKKQAFFEDHIYPMPLIPAQERTARLMQRWRPVGPSSESSQAVISRTLFVNEQLEARLEERQRVDELAVIGPQRWFTVDTRQTPAIKAATCQPITEAEASGLTISWVTETGGRAVKRLQSEQQRLRLPSAQRLYRFSADRRCQLNFYDAAGAGVTVDTNYLRAALAPRTDALTFALVSAAEQAQPLRLDARLVTSAGASLPADMALAWSVTDKAGAVLLQGSLHPVVQLNPYQVTVDSSLLSTVHEKRSEYIVAPATAAQLNVRLLSAASGDGVDALVNLYTRPAQLAYRVEPSDEEEPEQQSIPKWFLSQPAGQSNGQPAETRLLAWQSPLPEVVVNEMAEQQWYRLTSLEQAPYYELLLQEPQTEATEVAARLSFYPLQTNNAEYVLTTEEHEQAVTPQLVYQKSGERPVPVVIKVDGETLRDDWLYSSSGKLFLPPMQQGRYRLSLETPTAVNWYGNYQATEGQSLYRVRSAYQLRDTLTFDVRKRADEEWLTFNYFPAVGAAHEVSIRVEKRDRVGVFSDYTVSTRVFPIAERTAQRAVSLLNQDQPRIWQPLRLPFSLGADLNSGTYRVTVTSSVPNSGYVQAGYLAIAGEYETDVYREIMNASF